MSQNPDSKARGDREKTLVALSSVAAALVLTGGKIGVGLWTNSLGILSEAMHSGLDLVAALITLWAVRVSARPADRDHPYGHGKVENLSALFETTLLLLTCVWIVYEAGHRLLGNESVLVDANIWAFVVVIVSIIIDFSRARALKRTAIKYDSQALEADALHFSTDIWSSSVVLIGLICVRAADALGLPWLHKADAVAALGVALIVVWVSLKLGKKAIDDLLDSVPPDLPDRVRHSAESVDGVRSVRKVRVRRSGPDMFADVTVTAEPDVGLERAHDLATEVENAIKAELPKADVVVHVAPAEPKGDGLLTTVRRLAHRRGMQAHDIVVRRVGDEKVLEVHLDVSADLRMDVAHTMATQFEGDLIERCADVGRVVTHIEPIGRDALTKGAEPMDARLVLTAIAEMAAADGGEPQWHPSGIEVSTDEGELSVAFNCIMCPSQTVAEAHAMTERLERSLRERIPSVRRVVIHVEPSDGIG